MAELVRKKRKRRNAYDEIGGAGVRNNRTLFALLTLIPILITLLYGGTALFAMLLIGPLIAVLGVVWAVRAWRTGEIVLNADPLLFPLLALLGFSLFQLLPLGDAGVPPGALSIPASNALTLDPYATKIFILRLAGYIVFFAAALTFIDSEERLRKMVAAIAIFGGVIAFIGILQRLASPDAIYGVRQTAQAIPFGPYFNRHHFASLMVLFTGVVLSHVLGGGYSRDRKLLLAIPLVLMAAAVVLTGSRGGVIAYLATFGICLAGELRSGVRARLPLMLGAGGFGVFVVFLVIFLGGADALLRSTGLQAVADDISSGRTHFWAVAWQVFTANPIVGAGMEAFGVAFTQFDTRNGFYRVEQAHNDYLQLLADGGVIGLAIAVCFVLLLVTKGVVAFRDESASEFQRVTRVGAFAGCVGILVHSFVDFPLRTVSNTFFFLLVAALLAVPSFRREHAHRSTNGREL